MFCLSVILITQIYLLLTGALKIRELHIALLGPENDSACVVSIPLTLQFRSSFRYEFDKEFSYGNIALDATAWNGKL